MEWKQPEEVLELSSHVLQYPEVRSNRASKRGRRSVQGERRHARGGASTSQTGSQVRELIYASVARGLNKLWSDC